MRGMFVAERTNSNYCLLIPSSPWWRSKACSYAQHWRKKIFSLKRSWTHIPSSILRHLSLVHNFSPQFFYQENLKLPFTSPEKAPIKSLHFTNFGIIAWMSLRHTQHTGVKNNFFFVFRDHDFWLSDLPITPSESYLSIQM